MSLPERIDSFTALRGIESLLEEVAETGLRRLVIDQADSPLEGMLLTALAGVIAARASLADIRLAWDEHHVPGGAGIERVVGL